MKKLVFIIFIFIIPNQFVTAQIDLKCQGSLITYEPKHFQHNNFLFNITYNSLVDSIFNIVYKNPIDEKYLTNKALLYYVEIDSSGIICELKCFNNELKNKCIMTDIEALIYILQPLNPCWLVDDKTGNHQLIDCFFIDIYFFDKKNLKITFDYFE